MSYDSPSVTSLEAAGYFVLAGGLGFLVALGCQLIDEGPLRWRVLVGVAILSGIILGGLTIVEVSKNREKEAEGKKTGQPSS
jgi:hypothetical protein